MKNSTRLLFGAALSAGVVIAAVKLNRFRKMEPFGEPLSGRMVGGASEPAPNGKRIQAVLREARRDGKGAIRALIDLRNLEVELTIPHEGVL